MLQCCTQSIHSFSSLWASPATISSWFESLRQSGRNGEGNQSAFWLLSMYQVMATHAQSTKNCHGNKGRKNTPYPPTSSSTFAENGNNNNNNKNDNSDDCADPTTPPMTTPETIPMPTELESNPSFLNRSAGQNTNSYNLDTPF